MTVTDLPANGDAACQLTTTHWSVVLAAGDAGSLQADIANSILRGVSDSIFTQYNPTDIHLYYCNAGETWPGVVACNFVDPMFVDATNRSYALKPYSPEIDSGDPAVARDPDGTVSDIGYFPFVVPPPVFSQCLHQPQL